MNKHKKYLAFYIKIKALYKLNSHNTFKNIYSFINSLNDVASPAKD